MATEDTTPVAEPAPAVTSKRRWRGLLTNRDFMIVWGGFTVSSVGTALSNLAVPVLALGLSGSPVMAGLVGAARLAPYLLLNLLAGVFIDRWDRRRVMLVADLGRFAALATVPVAYAFGSLTIAHLAAVAFLEGVGHVFSAVAHLSALSKLVPEEQLASANALNEVADSAAGVGGSALSGVLIGLARNSTLGAVWSYAVDAVTYLLSGASLLFVRGSFQEERPADGRRSVTADLKEGMSFLWRQRLLRLLMLMVTSINFLQAPLHLATIVLATEDLGVNAGLIGLLLAGVGLGTVVSAFAASWLRERVSLRTLALGSVALWAVAAAATAAAQSVLLLAVGVLLTNLLWPVFAVSLVTYRLSVTPDHLQGRVNSAFRTLSFGVEPLGLALGGALIASLGPRSLFWGAAAGQFVILLGSAVAWRRKQVPRTGAAPLEDARGPGRRADGGP
ncbi:MFS transporter [Streptomyces sp. NPDC014656]|uniref:MFS transporter n=1 Tax=Streptomyces sp. NPDC014656 TaxID=3364878 RepID=UPI0036FE2E09